MEHQSSNLHRLKTSRGFSLFELLLTVAVLGIMAGVALTSFSQGQRDIVIESVHRRNAQSFSTIAECAQLAGVDPVIGTDVEATMRNIVVGVTATDGAMKGRTFKIYGISDADIGGAAYYMNITNGKLMYEANKPILMH